MNCIPLKLLSAVLNDFWYAILFGFVQSEVIYSSTAWLGLTPRQHSSGGKYRLLGISKRGDTYLRTLLIHGARAVLKVSDKKDDPRSRWLQNLCSRRNKNIAAVALANKNARIAWALLTKEAEFLPEGKPA